MALIDFHQVKKTYTGNDFVLGELDFNINEGEFLFLIGPSGSGKTSLIRLLIREEAPTEGRIFFDDYDITNLSRSNVYRLRRQIGVIFQDYKLIIDKNAYENVAFAMEAAGRTDKEIKETVPYVLDIVGLSHRAKAFPAQLSGGEKQRVAIARAVANNPRVLIADEPTGNLDPAAAWDIVQILSKINNWGTTVIMSTHGTDIVNSLNKRVIQMERGQIVRDDNKGRYEVVSRNQESKIKQQENEIEHDKKDAKKGPIKVKIQANAEEEEVKAPVGLFGRIFRRKETLPEPIRPDFEEAAEPTEAVDVPEPSSEQQAEKILEDADKTSLSELGLRKEVVADLKVAGYDDVEDVLSAGADKLGKELIIDPEEVVEVAKALSKYIAKEEEKLEPETKKEEKKSQPKAETKTEPKAEETEKPAKKRVKLDLTAK
jgi:cell division transport system ATP-binding protein